MTRIPAPHGLATSGACLLAVVLAGAAGCTGEAGGPGQAGSAIGASPPATAAADATGAIQACDVLTRRQAEEILGPVADLPTSAASEVADADLAVTSCTYVAEARNEADGRVAVGLVVRSALTPRGAAANRERFDPARRPEDARDVSGLGDEAFWTPGLGQLSILADDQWYVLTYGGRDPRESRLADVRRVAEQLGGRLGAAGGSDADPDPDPDPDSEGATP